MKSEVFLYRFFPFFFFYVALIGTVIPRASIFTQFIGGSVVLLIIYYYLKSYLSHNIFTALYVFLFYLAILLYFSSNLMYSFSNYLSTLIWTLILPISFASINSLNKLKKLVNSISLLALLYILNILICTALGIKGKSYSGEIFQTGNVFTEGLNSMTYILLLTPLTIYFNPKYKRMILLIAVTIFILVLIQFKRISIISTGIGLIIMLLYSKNRGKVLYSLLIGALLFLVSFPIFEESFNKQKKARERRITTQNIEEEGRYQETFVVIDEIIFSSRLDRLLFGKEIFNSPGNYANGKYGNRMIHSDYNAVLHGSGILGMFLYLFWQITLFLFYKKIKPFAKSYFLDKNLFDVLNVLFINFLIIGFIMAISGGINAVLFNSIRVVILGALLRIFYDAAKNQLLNKKKKTA